MLSLFSIPTLFPPKHSPNCMSPSSADNGEPAAGGKRICPRSLSITHPTPHLPPLGQPQAVSSPPLSQLSQQVQRCSPSHTPPQTVTTPPFTTAFPFKPLMQLRRRPHPPPRVTLLHLLLLLLRSTPCDRKRSLAAFIDIQRKTPRSAGKRVSADGSERAGDVQTRSGAYAGDIGSHEAGRELAARACDVVEAVVVALLLLQFPLIMITKKNELHNYTRFIDQLGTSHRG